MPLNPLPTARVASVPNHARQQIKNEFNAQKKVLDDGFAELSQRCTNIEQIQDNWRFEDDIPADQWQGQIMAKAVADACREDPAFAPQMYALDNERLVTAFANFARPDLRKLECAEEQHNRFRSALGAVPYSRPLSDPSKHHGTAKTMKAMRDQQAEEARNASVSAQELPGAAEFRQAYQACRAHGMLRDPIPYVEADPDYLGPRMPHWKPVADPDGNTTVPMTQAEAKKRLTDLLTMQPALLPMIPALMQRLDMFHTQHDADAWMQMVQDQFPTVKAEDAAPRAGPSMQRRPMPMMMGPDVPGGYYVPADARASNPEGNVYVSPAHSNSGPSASRMPPTIVLVERE